MIPPETLVELTQLRNRVAYLEAELALVRETGSRRIGRLMSSFHITKGQARTILALTQGVLTRDQAMGLDIHRVEDASPRALDSLVKNLRRRLLWLRITTIYGIGYTIDHPESLHRIRAVMEAQP